MADLLEVPQWRLDLDEEGYPILDQGLRADDEEFCKEVFSNLRRYNGDDRQCLVTEVEGKSVAVTSYDDPLHAQSVEIHGQKLVWNFLGGLKHESQLSDILEDEWKRLHAFLGPERIPAVMSRKAQAGFLLKLPNPQTIHPRPYRSAGAEAAEISRWEKRYIESDTPWDMSEASPVFLAHGERMLTESGPDVFYPGAGTAYEIPFFEKRSKHLWALDVSESAKARFRAQFPGSKAKYQVGDFFETHLGPFDLIYENYFFVALDPALRPQIVKRVWELLRPGGLWGGVFFTRMAESGPAFGLTEWELKAHTEAHFEILEWTRSRHSHPKRRHMEVWALLRKKT